MSLSEVKIIGKATDSASLYKEVLVNSSGAMLVSGVSGGGGTVENIMKCFDGIDGSGTERTVKSNADGRLETMMVGANDTAGGLPHRNMTIDGNGRTHTIARIEQSPTINSKLDTISTTMTGGTQLSGITGRGDDGTQYPIRCNNSGNQVNLPQAVYLSTPFTLGDNASTSLSLNVNGDLKVVEKNTNTENEGAGAGSPTTRVMTSSKLVGKQQGSLETHNLLCDSVGVLFAGVGGYTDISDLTTWGRIKATTNGDLFTCPKQNSILYEGTLSASGGISTQIDIGDYTQMRIWGDSTTTDPITVDWARTSGNFSPLQVLYPVATGTGGNTFTEFTPIPPKYVRFRNPGVSDMTVSIKIELSH